MIVQKFQIGEYSELTAYLHSPSDEMQTISAVKRPAMIICPGGGYQMCTDREADSPMITFLNMGLQVFVLRYSVGANAGNKNPLTELATAIKLVRERCDQWQVDQHKIAVCGFSAGAHLAASLGVHWDDPEILSRCDESAAEQLRPDAMVLCYPVILSGKYAHEDSIRTVSGDCDEDIEYWSLEQQVDENTPPVFLWHTMEDEIVPVENSLAFVTQLHKYGVSCECHLFECGNHGLSTATLEVGTPSRAAHEWVTLCKAWLHKHFGALPGEID